MEKPKGEFKDSLEELEMGNSPKWVEESDDGEGEGESREEDGEFGDALQGLGHLTTTRLVWIGQIADGIMETPNCMTSDYLRFE